MKNMSNDHMMTSLLSALTSSIGSDSHMSIVEFAEQIVFNGDPSFSLFPQQAALLKAFYGEPLTERDLLILGNWQLEDRTTWEPTQPSYVNLVLECGRRGTKSTIASLIALRELYDLITLESPAKTYNLAPNDPIAIFVIAQSQEQVVQTIFAKIKGYAEFSYYFKGLVHNGLLEILSEEIRYPSKNIGIYAKHTNAKSLVGYSLKCLILDEAARFETNEDGINNAFYIWDNVGAGASTFKDKGRRVAISSAWEIGDPLEELYQRSLKDPSTLAFRLTTFHLNPNLSKETGVIASQYATNPSRARLEYEGIRSGKHATYLNRENIEKACTGLVAATAYSTPLDLSVGGDLRYYVGVQVDGLAPHKEYPSFIHVDPALKKDSAALAMCHSVLLPDGRYGIQVDLILQWKPYMDANANKRLVSFTNIEANILKLCEYRKVYKVSFDSFNSAALIQQLHMKGVPTLEVSSSRASQNLYYSLLNDLINANLIVLPANSTWTPDMRAELSELVMRPNGQIIHPCAGKDIADAICIAIYQCYLYQVASGITHNILTKVSKVDGTHSHLTKSHTDHRQLIKMGNAINKVLKHAKNPHIR